MISSVINGFVQPDSRSFKTPKSVGPILANRYPTDCTNPPTLAVSLAELETTVIRLKANEKIDAVVMPRRSEANDKAQIEPVVTINSPIPIK